MRQSNMKESSMKESNVIELNKIELNVSESIESYMKMHDVERKSLKQLLSLLTPTEVCTISFEQMCSNSCVFVFLFFSIFPPSLILFNSQSV